MYHSIVTGIDKYTARTHHSNRNTDRIRRWSRAVVEFGRTFLFTPSVGPP